MSRLPAVIGVAVLLVLSLAAGWFLRAWLVPDEPAAVLAPLPEPHLGQRRPDFSLPDLSGQHRGIEEWQGQVLLVNFWATWCSPCREEIPEFMELHDRYAERGFSLLGIAIDRAEAVRDYAGELGIHYPLLVGELDAINLAEAMGNPLGALPYSVVLDRDGRMVFSHHGRLPASEAEAAILEVL